MPLLNVPGYRPNQAPLVFVVATAAARPGHFVATLNGTALITASKTPMCAACCGLLAEGFDPDAIVVLKHACSPTVCLTAKLGLGAGAAPSSPASTANRLRASESSFAKAINDFCNKIDTQEPSVWGPTTAAIRGAADLPVTRSS
jgi:hypothetical protein